jgi:hypothetical protein
MTLLDVLEARGDRTKVYFRFYFAVLGLLFLVSSLGFVAQWDPIPGETPHTAVDFDAFHLVGQLVLSGNIASAYDALTLFKLQQEAFGQEIFMPWTYPPQFNLIVGGLALLPIGVAYGLFVAGTFVAYLFVLKKLAQDDLITVLFVLTPAISVMIKCGQNGFLTGALFGLSCLWLLRRGARAGVPISCLVIKPHLAVGLAVLVAVQRRWGVVMTAIAGVLATSALATVVMGPGVWTAFLGSIPQARVLMEAGAYPLYRMVSPYAAAFTLGAPASVAIAIQAAVAIGALITIAAATRVLPQRQSIGLAVVGSLLVSPYVYDYDVVILGAGLALLIPALRQFASGRERVVIYALAFASGGLGLAVKFTATLAAGGAKELVMETGAALPSLGAWTLIALFALVSRVLWRARQSSPAGAPVAAAA